MSSNHYRELLNGIKVLRRHLLPSRFDEFGGYRERVFTGVVAFQVLSHAAIEEYIEERVVEIATIVSNVSKKSRSVTVPATCLVAFSGMEMRAPPLTLDPIQPTKKDNWDAEVDFKSKVERCATDFIRKIRTENHGVRERNLISMLIPIGIRHSSIDRFLLGELDNFGKIRGEYAHSAFRKHVTKKPNPKDEYNRVINIINLLSPLDKLLDDLLLEVRKADV